jgi:hypothetical protein
MFFKTVLFLLALTFPIASFGLTFSAAKIQWQEHVNLKSFQQYMVEFVYFNNHYHLDSKDGCYAKKDGRIIQFLVVNHHKDAQYAVIESVVSNVDNDKSRCFTKAYKNAKVRTPPYSPFIIRMEFK